MKKFIISITKIIFLYLFQLINLNSQYRDSVFFTKDAELSYYTTYRVKYQGDNEIKLENKLSNFDDVTKITFKRNDSVLFNGNNNSYLKLHLNDINELSIYKEKVNPVIITIFGGVIGCFTGALIGSALPQPEGWAKLNTVPPAVTGAILGAAGGAIIGYLITRAVNDIVLDLFSVPEKDKKNKLLKFLNNK